MPVGAEVTRKRSGPNEIKEGNDAERNATPNCFDDWIFARDYVRSGNANGGSRP